MEGEWEQRRGHAMDPGEEMTKETPEAIAVKFEELVGRLQEQYGMDTEEAGGQPEESKTNGSFNGNKINPAQTQNCQV